MNLEKEWRIRMAEFIRQKKMIRKKNLELRLRFLQIPKVLLIALIFVIVIQFI